MQNCPRRTTSARGMCRTILHQVCRKAVTRVLLLVWESKPRDSRGPNSAHESKHLKAWKGSDVRKICTSSWLRCRMVAFCLPSARLDPSGGRNETAKKGVPWPLFCSLRYHSLAYLWAYFGTNFGQITNSEARAFRRYLNISKFAGG